MELRCPAASCSGIKDRIGADGGLESWVGSQSRQTTPRHETNMSAATLKSLFGHKAWANSELFALLATLPEQATELLHGCIRTLNHIYVVDRLFRARLSSEKSPFEATNTEASPSLEQLRQEVAATDAWYQSHVASIADEELSSVLEFTFTDGDAGRMSREEVLLHVLTHGAYHRGNVGQLLKSISVAPPRDLYTKFLHQSEPSRRSA
jgi:uncharacterized damage-inducible protein DinB